MSLNMRYPILLLILFGLNTTLAQTDRPKQSKPVKPKKLRECPDQWCIDRRPTLTQPGEESKAHEYYMLRGKRYEKEAFDHSWLAKNCQLELTIVR